MRMRKQKKEEILKWFKENNMKPINWLGQVPEIDGDIIRYSDGKLYLINYKKDEVEKAGLFTKLFLLVLCGIMKTVKAVVDWIFHTSSEAR